MANAVAKKLDLPYAALLRSTAKAAQKKMREQERIKNATFDYRKSDISIKGKRVILIDDIVTTGASMAVSTKLLIRARARTVICLSVGATEK